MRMNEQSKISDDINTLTPYEKKQNRNFLTKWLGTFRYRKLIELTRELARETEGVVTVCEIGAASGKLYSVLSSVCDIDYVGLEYRQDRVDIANKRFGDQGNFRIKCGKIEENLSIVQSCDLIVALETFEHIQEHHVVRVVEHIAKVKPKLFVCSVPVEVGPVVWVKNVGSLLMGYRSRYSSYYWSETFWAGLYMMDKVRPHKQAHRGFDWRWLAQTIRHNMHKMETHSLPYGWLPMAFSTNAMFVSRSKFKTTNELE